MRRCGVTDREYRGKVAIIAWEAVNSDGRGAFYGEERTDN